MSIHQQLQNDPLEFARQYAEIDFGAWKQYLSNIVSKLLEKYVKGTGALDFGCGTGESTLYLKSLHFNVDGVDINPDAINTARHRDPTGKYEVIKNGEIPRENNVYDLIFCSWVLLFVKTKEEMIETCKELSRVLKKGGTLVVIIDDESKYLCNNWQLVEVDFEENKNLTSGSVTKTMFKCNNYIIYARYWTDEDYYEALVKAGLTVMHLHKPKDEVNNCDTNKETEVGYARIFIAQKL